MTAYFSRFLDMGVLDLVGVQDVIGWSILRKMETNGEDRENAALPTRAWEQGKRRLGDKYVRSVCLCVCQCVRVFGLHDRVWKGAISCTIFPIWLLNFRESF